MCGYAAGTPLVLGRALGDNRRGCPVATKKIALNKAPHVVEIGDEFRLEFVPEVYGDEFVDAYQGLQDTFKRLGIDLGNLAGSNLDRLGDAYSALRSFLAKLMLPASAEEFARWDVVAGGETIGTFHDWEEAASCADEQDGAEVVSRCMRLPDRVLGELMDFVMEQYGGGRPPTSSSVSAASSPPRGRSGTGTSPSRASTRTRGR